MTFGFCSLLTTHENTKLTVMIQNKHKKRLRHNNDRKSQKRQKNWKSTRGVAPTKSGIILVVTVTGWGGSSKLYTTEKKKGIHSKQKRIFVGGKS